MCRVGRTARYLNIGRALLLLAPSERDGMLAALSEAKIPLKQLKHNPAKVQSVGPALQALLSKSPELKVGHQGSAYECPPWTLANRKRQAVQ